MAVFRTEPSASISIYDREIEGAPASNAETRHAGDVQIGIRWDCVNCDLDLYACPHPQAEVIYFGAMETQAGRLFKDYRQSPSISNGFETVSFHAPIDLDKLDLAVNFYGGAATSRVNGEIRIAIGAKTWARRFTFDVASGNGGGGVETLFKLDHAPNAHWLKVNPLAVIGLRSEG